MVYALAIEEMPSSNSFIHGLKVSESLLAGNKLQSLLKLAEYEEELYPWSELIGDHSTKTEQ